MNKLNDRQISKLKVGESVVIRPSDKIIQKVLEPSEYKIVDKREDGSCVLFDAEVYKALEENNLLDTINNDNYRMFLVEYKIGDKNVIELLTKEDLIKKSIEKGKDLVENFLIENIENINVEVFSLGQIEKISSKIMNQIEEFMRTRENDDYELHIGSDVVDGMRITYDSDEDKWEVFREGVKTKSKPKVVKEEDFTFEDRYDSRIKFVVEHPLYNEIVERAIEIEDSVFDSEEDMDSRNNFLSEYLLTDEHTYIDIIQLLGSYATESERKEIMKNAKFHIIKK